MVRRFLTPTRFPFGRSKSKNAAQNEQNASLANVSFPSFPSETETKMESPMVKQSPETIKFVVKCEQTLENELQLQNQLKTKNSTLDLDRNGSLPMGQTESHQIVLDRNPSYPNDTTNIKLNPAMGLEPIDDMVAIQSQPQPTPKPSQPLTAPLTLPKHPPPTDTGAGDAGTDPKTVHCLHILVKHRDSRRPSSWRSEIITRSKEEAIEELLGYRERVLADCAEGYDQGRDEAEIEERIQSFMRVAQEVSDCSSYKHGGDLGQFARGEMMKEFEDIGFGLEIGQMSGVVETSSGVHIIMRVPDVIEEEKTRETHAHCRHILIKHAESRNPSSWRSPSITRSRADAKKKLENIIEHIKNGGGSFSKIASEQSDCSSAKRGGDLGVFGRGEMQKPFEEATFALDKGQLSDIVETNSGYHLIQRLD